jgi:NADPH-dependent 2,4-dienoyl-CoA reductase/sulfur reductase-like enzyme/rhodanese-related sulfurtransferase
MPKATITLFHREEHFSYGTCGLPYFASGDIGSFEELMRTSWGTVRDAEFFAKAKGFTAIPAAEVTAIDRRKKTVTVNLLNEGQTVEHGYGKLVLATGATPNQPPFRVPTSDRVRSFTRPADAIHFRRLAETGRLSRVVIVGGGFIGCELAESAAGLWGLETTLVEKEPQLLPYALDPEMVALVTAAMRKQGVKVRADVAVEKVVEDGSELIVSMADGASVSCDYLFLCLGVKPLVSLASGSGLAIGETGGIVVNERMQTSDPDIYAGGDCVESVHQLTGRRLILPMGSLANRHGRIIAENISGHAAEFPGVLGAFLLKCFDLNVGAVGLSEEAAVRAGLKAGAVWGTFADKPDFYPESATVTAKMVYDRDDFRLLGLQVVGAGDVCRRVDVFSAFLGRKGTVEDLLKLEHGYAPPYAEAQDPLHHLAAMATAQQRGFDMTSPAMTGKAGRNEADMILLDVRTKEEAVADPIPAGRYAEYINLPLEELAAGLSELDSNRETVIICRRGPRSYQAAVILRNAGFAGVRFVGGGVTALPPTNNEDSGDRQP